MAQPQRMSSTLLGGQGTHWWVRRARTKMYKSPTIAIVSRILGYSSHRCVQYDLFGDDRSHTRDGPALGGQCSLGCLVRRGEGETGHATYTTSTKDWLYGTVRSDKFISLKRFSPKEP